MINFPHTKKGPHSVCLHMRELAIDVSRIQNFRTLRETNLGRKRRKKQRKERGVKNNDSINSGPFACLAYLAAIGRANALCWDRLNNSYCFLAVIFKRKYDQLMI